MSIVKFFDNIESNHLKKLYFQGGLTLDNDTFLLNETEYEDDLSDFISLAENAIMNPKKSLKISSPIIKFIIQWRNTSVSEDDPLLDFWLQNVVPSCVYPLYINDEIAFYKCCLCITPFKSQAPLIRHYKECHFYEIPKGIFGELTLFHCKACGYTFRRKEHLNRHNESLGHLNKSGNYDDLHVVNLYMKAKNESNVLKNTKRKRALANVSNEWFRYNESSLEKYMCIEANEKNNDLNKFSEDIITYSNNTITRRMPTEYTFNSNNNSEKIVIDLLESLINKTIIEEEKNSKVNSMIRSLSDDLIKNLCF
jgi:hypothetical protein